MSGRIGVYDSGFGGLTVLRELRRELPRHDFVYLGDSGRAPYGQKDAETVLDLAEQCVERLFEEGCRLVVVACHTVSSVALRHLQARYGGAERRVLGVTIPAAEAAVAQRGGPLALIGTPRTVASGTFTTEVHKLDPERVVLERAAALLAPIVEEGWEDTPVAHAAVARYLEGLPPDSVLVLGCTHYPLLMNAIRAAAPAGATVLDPAPYVAARLADWLTRHPGFAAPGSGSLRALSTGEPERFGRLGARFLGEPLPLVEHVAETAGRLMPAPRANPRGQLVRPLTTPRGAR